MSFYNLRHKRHIVFTSMKKEVISSFAQVKITFTGHAIIPHAYMCMYMYVHIVINQQNGPLTNAVIVVYINNSVFS